MTSLPVSGGTLTVRNGRCENLGPPVLVSIPRQPATALQGGYRRKEWMIVAYHVDSEDRGTDPLPTTPYINLTHNMINTVGIAER